MSLRAVSVTGDTSGWSPWPPHLSDFWEDLVRVQHGIRSRAMGLAAGLALIAASCGGSGDDGESTSGTVDENVKSEIQAALNSTTTAAASSTTVSVKPSSMVEWEALWSKERDAVVKRIKDNKWGLQPGGKTVLGPEGFTIDLAKCTPGWSNTEGLTDTSIKLGSHTPFSGTLADAGNINKGMDTVFKFYSEKGLFKDSTGKTRTLTMISKDDGYDPARSIPLVDEFLDSDKVFGIQGLGTPSVMKTYDKINLRCVPHPFAITGHPAWGDPVNHPWTTGILFAYNTEAVLWGSFIDKNFDKMKGADGKVTVAALVMNNDFGKSYEAGFKAYLETSPNKANIAYVTETIEPSAPTIKDAMTSLASKNPQMFVAMTAGTSCTQAIVEASENGMKQNVKYLWMPSVCKPSSQVGKDKVGGDGSATNGWWIMGGGGRDFNSPGEDGNPFIVWGRDLLKQNGLDSKSSGNLGSGISFGWSWSQTVAIAGQLEGGLTRVNLITAARAMEMTHPAYLDGIKFNLNGNKDAYWIEGSEIARYDSVKQSWIPQGDIIELSGKSSPCAWNQSIANCK